MTQSTQILGVIGGLGPLATSYFMELVTNMTDSKTDQHHLEMIIHSAPFIPDRTAYILGESQNDPCPEMIRIGRNLALQKVSRIAIPCITAHYFLERLEEGIPVPLINGVRETVRHLKENGITRVGIMATSGTIRAGIFRRELELQGLQAVIPDQQAQADVMHLIFENIKAGRPPEMDRFQRATKHLHDAGAEAIILGCTELSLIKRDCAIGSGFLDAMEVLAREAVFSCGYPVKEEYSCLIT
jgi:aspartate racemase